MKISTSYKYISTLLSFSIVLSLTVSICSMSTMQKMCDQMMMDHDSMEMVEMKHDAGHKDMMHEKEPANSSDCSMTIDCDCSSEVNFLATIAPNVVLKTNIFLVIVSLSETNTIDRNTSSTDLNLSIQNHYSPPPLFLANEAFLI
ncbi:MAG: hypothetical protein ABJK11_05185 [Balneola sp.]